MTALELFSDPDQPFDIGTKRELQLLKFSSVQAGDGYMADVGYSPALFTQVSLPYKDPRNKEVWVRKNGEIRMQLSPRVVQDPLTMEVTRLFPFGLIPRLLIAYLTTEATRTGNARIELGKSLSAFMRKIDLTHTGNNSKRLRDQMERFFGASMQFEGKISNEGGSGSKKINFQFATELTTWDPVSPDGTSPIHRAPWENEVTLSPAFLKEATGRPVPIDLNVIKVLQSPMAIDIYQWLTHKMYSLREPMHIRIKDLETQFGSDYQRREGFRKNFLANMSDVLKVYSYARVEYAGNDLLILRPSDTSVPKTHSFRKPPLEISGEAS